jgi:hypothetical protein
MGCVVEDRQDVFTFQKRIIYQDFLEGCTGAQQLENVCNSDTLAANAWSAPVLASLDSDSMKTLQGHRTCPFYPNISCVLLKGKFG